MATKSNAQRYAYVLWDEVLEELRAAVSRRDQPSGSTATP